MAKLESEMKKTIKRVLLIILVAVFAGLVFMFTYVPPLSEQHGIVETKLYLGASDNQPLIVAFGGSGGGNDWSRNYMKEK